MIKSFIVYDYKGAILRTGTAPNTMVQIQAQEGEYVMDGEADELTQYIARGNTVADKPAMDLTLNKTSVAANGMDTFIIGGIPEGAAYQVNGQSGVVDDGTLEVTFDLAGEYQIKLELFPYLDAEILINAT